MAGTVSAHQLSSYANPQAGQAAQASVVLGNDNTTVTSYNAHDSDATIHLQNSTLSARPAAAVAQRIWFTTDGLRLYYDTGSTWNEAAYVTSTVPGTITSTTTPQFTLAYDGSHTATWSVSNTGALTIAATASTVQMPALAVGQMPGSFDSTDNHQSLAIISTGAVKQDIVACAFTGGGAGAAFHGNYARGTFASPAAQQAGDVCLSIGGRSWNPSTGFFDGSSVAVIGYVDATATGQYTESYLTLGTTPHGGTRIDYALLDKTGFLGLADASHFAAGTRPGYLLHVYNTTDGNTTSLFQATAASNPVGIGIDYSGGAPNDTAHSFVKGFDTGATRCDLRSNGGLANFSANNVNLSDADLKEDLHELADEITEHWKKHLALRVVRGKYKDQTHDDYYYMGVAQNVEEQYPESVEESDMIPGMKAKVLYENDLVWISRAVLIEAQRRIEALEAKIA